MLRAHRRFIGLLPAVPRKNDPVRVSFQQPWEDSIVRKVVPSFM